MKILILILSALTIPGLTLHSAERKSPVASQSVNVQFQMMAPGGAGWSTGTTTLRGSATESMIRNALASRWPNHKIRILAVDTGNPVRHLVQFQVSRDRKMWNSGSTVLLNARTQSMAKNQIAARYPGMHVRILGMTRQR